MRNLSYCSESENILETKGNKMRVLGYTNNFKPCARYQKPKQDDQGFYLLGEGEKFYFTPEALTPITEEDLIMYS